MADIIVTGLPRAGATLVSALIDGLPDSICLNEPPYYLLHNLGHPLAYSKWIAGDFLWVRQRLRKGNDVVDFRDADGLALLDSLKDPRRPPQPMRSQRPPMQGDFLLAVKHTLLFSAVLPTLAEFEHFKILAVIRHPIDTLMSWQTGGKEVFSRIPRSFKELWPEAADILAQEWSPDRLAQLYELHLWRYHELRDRITIIKYEDVVKNPMLISERFGKEVLPEIASRIEQRPRVYQTAQTEALRNALQKYATVTKQYYPHV